MLWFGKLNYTSAVAVIPGDFFAGGTHSPLCVGLGTERSDR